MKTLHHIFSIIILSIAFIGCSDDDDKNPIEFNPVEGLNLLYEISAADHLAQIYSEKQSLEVGYNEISIRIKDLGNNQYISNAAPTWVPMMYMESMAHSAPHSGLRNAEENTVYKGYIVFQMASNSTEFWEISLQYNLNGNPVEESVRVSVAEPTNGLKKTQVFMGSDNERYILAYVNPQSPAVAVNDLQSVLHKMETMMSFPKVEHYKITVDPRMPGMGNHSSPNNEDMTYNGTTQMYHGKLSLTMTGYWKINLKLINQNGEVLKGEDVTEANPASSLYFELEF